MNLARASPDAAAAAEKLPHATTSGLHSVATTLPTTERRETSAAAFVAVGAAFPGSGFVGNTTLGATGAPDSALRAALIISAGDRPAGTTATGAGAAEAAGAAAGAPAAAAGLPALRIESMMLAAEPAAAGFAAAGFAAGVAAAAAAGLPALRMDAMMSAGERGADGACAAAGAGGAAAASAFGSAVGSEPAAAAAAAAFWARIFERMSFGEGFGSLI